MPLSNAEKLVELTPEPSATAIRKAPEALRRARSIQRRKATWNRKKKQPLKAHKATVPPTGAVSDETLQRLINEAMGHPLYIGMTREEVGLWVRERITVVMPWWYGHLPGDKPKRPATEAQLRAIEKARQRKRQIQQETDAPYVPT